MKICKKIFIYCLGLFFLALGVTFSIKSQLGISPINSIPYIISLITGFEQGHIIIGIFSIFILIQIVLLRKNFKIINLFQIIFSVVFGYFVTFTNSLIIFESPESYIAKLGLLFISMVFVAIGVILYLRAEMVPLPAEGCMLAIQSITKKEFHRIKTSFDVSLVITAAGLSIVFLGEFNGVREGTIISAIGIGKIIGFIENNFDYQIENLLKFLQS